MRQILGHSLEGRAITIYSNFDLDLSDNLGGAPKSLPPNLTLLLGGTHGDELATIPLLENFIDEQLSSKKNIQPTIVLPLLNPDGHHRLSRYNARGVDLNRNFPHLWKKDSEEPAGERPLSEPEASMLFDFISTVKPAKIVSLHWALAELDADGGQSLDLANAMWKSLADEEKRAYRLKLPRLKSETDLGSQEQNYCSGSLGQWCGYGLTYPDGKRPAMITLELPYHAHSEDRPEILADSHLDQVRDLWTNRRDHYLEKIQGPVHKVLAAACYFDEGKN